MAANSQQNYCLAMTPRVDVRSIQDDHRCHEKQKKEIKFVIFF